MKTLYTITVFFALLCIYGLSPAQHTFSIVAVDPITGEVGGAGATCLTSADCGGCGGAVIISGISPGRGAINAQATVCLPNSNLNNMISLMNTGNSPQQILDNILIFDACQFGDSSNRQYGIADLDSNSNPRTVGFTGSNALNYGGHRVGPNYSIQGNILLGPQILDSMEANFLNTPGPLCEKLMAALQGANVPGADTRCLPDSISSKSSFIRVARPNDTPTNMWLNLIVPATNPLHDPIDSLQSLFDQFKLVNGLPVAPNIPELLLFPNPNNGRFTLDFSDLNPLAPVLEVRDVLGALVLKMKLEPAEKRIFLDLGDIGTGKILFVSYTDREAQVYLTKKVALR